MKHLKLFAALCCAAAVLAACDQKNEPVNEDQNDGQNDNQQEVPGTADGHEWVDLGLPSGLKWATCNVGATAPEGYGNYYAWGETEPKDYYSWETYKYGSSEYELTKYVDDSYFGLNGFRDNKTMLAPEDDAASVCWGGEWRTPTYAECIELLKQCNWTWTSLNRVNGYRVTSKTNGNFIFLPAAGSYEDDGVYDKVGDYGCYWSSSLGYTSGVNCLGFHSSDVGTDWDYRYSGRTIRPVCNVDVTAALATADGHSPD